MARDATSTEDMWTPYKELQTYVENMVVRPDPGSIQAFESKLRSFKQNFITLLKNPPKNSQHREELRKGITEGVNLPGVGHQVLSKQLVDETLIISDMFDLNEYMALDLLCTAQDQMPYYPGLPRGLVAMILYYDGRKCLVSALRALVQARKGISWTVGASPELTDFITKYTRELMEDGVLNRVIDLLETVDLTKEIELLQQNRGLGGPKHHNQVVELINGIRQGLADVVYCWAAQTGLPRNATLSLINLLKRSKVEISPGGGIDNVTLTLQMALLYTLDLSVLQRRDDLEDVVQYVALLCDPEFFNSLMKELLSPDPWECQGLQGITQLAFAITLAVLREAPSHLQSIRFTDEDSQLVDSANQRNVFCFMQSTFLENESIYKEEFYLRRLHTFVTDFIVHMPMKVRKMKSAGDSTSETIQVYYNEGLEPPANLSHHFEHLLLTVARLYRDNVLPLDLRLEYWSAVDSASSDLSMYRSTSRQAMLFKFLRLGGDAPTPGLFVPYLKMLSSLASSKQAAKNAFNLLKQNVSTVSWDHFFSSLERYYSNLRQELPPSTDTVYHQHVRNYPRGITPQEMQGLQAVLSVIRAVAEHDPMSRLALCDNPQWAPLNVLLGLVSCSVPIPLKAELLCTLAALAMSPKTATSVWYSLEASQILTTIPTTSSYQPRGIQTELEEIETRNEEFPLTRALLRLLDVLTNVQVPRLLGVGTRTPGFDPYLNFIVNSVFLRFNTRNYKHPEEKWEVAKSCLNLLYKLLVQYKPQATDFNSEKVEMPGGGSYQVNPLPGFHLMVNLNSKSELLRLVLYLLDEGVHLLDTYAPFPGKKLLEDSLLCCLNLLDHALSLQNTFFSVLSSSQSSLLLTRLSKLLLGMNPRSGKPDHLLNIVKYVTYNAWLPEHSLMAVKILLDVSLVPSAQSQLIGIFTSTTSLTLNIRHGFVECLEADEEDVVEDEDSDREEELGVQGRCKEAILKLLQQCLHLPSPNLTHYLLGFELKKDIRKTMFQKPGILGFPRTCLHSILSLLDASVEAKSAPYVITAKPRLLEAAYCLLYMLCANVYTSQPILRYLRASNDFLHRHLDTLPLVGYNQASQLSQMSWLLKCVAIEIRTSANNLNYSQLNRLVNDLVQERDAPSPPTVPKTEDQLIVFHNIKKKQPLLTMLLDMLNFHVPPVTQPEWECFEPSRISELISKCEMGSGSSKKLIDVKKLHSLLAEDLSSLQNSSVAGQRPLLVTEIEKILKYAIRVNHQRVSCNAVVRFMDGWRQVAEVMFAVAPREVLPYEAREVLLVDTILLLFRKVVPGYSLPELANIASGVVMLFMANLRHCHIAKRKEGPQPGFLTDNMEQTMEDSFNLSAKEGLFSNLLSGLLRWIMDSDSPSQKQRINLYAALLSLLKTVFSGDSDKHQRTVSELGSMYISRLDSSQVRATVEDTDKNRRVFADCVRNFGDKLLSVLCHDSTGGHDVCKMLGLACLGALIEYDPQSNCVSFLSTRGYIKYILDSLVNCDDKLISLLDDVPVTLSPLYVYEAKMALLCHIASSRTGAETLLEEGAFGCLATMTVYDRHPEVKGSALNLDLGFLPSVGSRYVQIMFPALYLCDNILTALGAENVSGCNQVQYFLLSHSDAIHLVLRYGNPMTQTVFLKELALLTGIIARITTKEVIKQATTVDAQAHLKRIHTLMMGLLPRFTVCESTIQKLIQSGAGSQTTLTNNEKMQVVLHFLHVACNLLQYIRNIIASRGLNQRATEVLFRASLGDTLVANLRSKDFKQAGEGATPTLGVVAYQLVQSVGHYNREKTHLEVLSRKRLAIGNMNQQELKELVPDLPQTGTDLKESRALASEFLEKSIANKVEELKYCSYIVDNTLYLIWSHLDYYMLRGLPKSCFGIPRTRGNELLTETSWKTSAEDIAQLKQDLVSVFNDGFCKQLLDTKEGTSEADQGFVEALVRRIKRLVQFVPVK